MGGEITPEVVEGLNTIENLKAHEGDGEITHPEYLKFISNPDMKQFYLETLKKRVFKVKCSHCAKDSFITIDDSPLKDVLPHFFTKELKVSNIERTDLFDISEDIDISWQTFKMVNPNYETNMGIKFEDTFSFMMLMIMNAKLAGSSSVDGFERFTQVTNRNIHDFPNQKSGGIFGFMKKKEE